MAEFHSLSRKARLLLSYLEASGGGIIDEWRIKDATDLSHGSICAARRELIEAGYLGIAKEFRKTVYVLKTPPPFTDKADEALENELAGKTPDIGYDMFEFGGI